MNDPPGVISTRQFTFLLFAVVLTRIPFLWYGYGSDPDAWRIAWSGSTLWHSGAYHVSRFPGYPLMEFLSAPLVSLGGPLLSNSSTLVGFLLLLIAWKGLVERYSTYPFMLLIAVAFAPFLWKNSSVTMDHVWSMCFILFSFSALNRQRYLLGGLFTGLAAGFRPTAAVIVLPFLLLLVLRKAANREILKYFFSAVITTMCCYVPLMLTYGLHGWILGIMNQAAAVDLPALDQALYFAYRSITFLGLPALITLLVILVRKRKALISQHGNRDPVLYTSIAGALIFVVVFWLFPLEREYLLPAIPFALLVVDRIASKREMQVLLISIISLAFLNLDLVRHVEPAGKPGVNIRSGVVVEEWKKRERLFEVREYYAGLDVGPNAVVLTGGDVEVWFENNALEVDTSLFWASMGEMVARQRSNPTTFFISSLTKTELLYVRSSGFRIYYAPWMKHYIERISGYRMEDENIIPLPQNP